MKKISTLEAIGQVLSHDITQIIPGKFKGPVFKKGHIITKEDIPILLSVGKDQIYVFEYDESMYHEDEAAKRLANMCGQENMMHSSPSEGKIELTAAIDGLFIVDNEALNIVNSFGDMMIATRPSGFVVKKGDKLAATRIIPLVIKKDKIHKVESLLNSKPIMKVVPIKKKTYGLITTGNEVFFGRIKDLFTPILNEKLSFYGAKMVEHVVLNDDPNKITAAINKMLEGNVDMVFCTGGMSVDPDDQTPLAIKNSKVDIVTYGAPILPGAMFLISYAKDGRPVLGLPGCIMYAKRTVFDLLLPRILCDIKIDKKLIDSFGNGGLCLNCPTCNFPNCSFGKAGH